MTSKEALKNIEKQSTVNILNHEPFCYFEKELNAIQKDLEILEILKNILKIKKSDLYGFEIVVRGSDEQENKVKEWLEDE